VHRNNLFLAHKIFDFVVPQKHKNPLGFLVQRNAQAFLEPEIKDFHVPEIFTDFSECMSFPRALG
jgi:hypothetical protein